MQNWIELPDKTYQNFPDIVVHEVRCPKCHHQETYLGNEVPSKCYICDEERSMPEVH